MTDVELFAYLTDDDEVAYYEIDNRERVPLIALDRHTAEIMEPMARNIAAEIRSQLRFVRFSEIEELAIVRYPT